MAATVSREILGDVAEMKKRADARDERMRKVRRVRDGELQSLWPDHFSDRFPQAIVANFVDAAARDLAEVLAPLPRLDCASGAMKTAADKRRAENKNRIGEHYWHCSKLQAQMFYGADQYITYGFLPAWIAPNLAEKRPVIRLEDPTGCYYETDRDMKVLRFAKSWKQDVDDLAEDFPDVARQIKYPDGYECGEDELEVIRYIDDTNVTVYLPGRSGLILSTYPHRMGRCPVALAQRPGLHTDPRGQFDDALYVQLARAVMAQLALEAGHKAVQAPIVIPNDVQEIGIGPDAVIQTDQGPRSVGRMEIHVPPEAFALQQQLDQEMKVGTRYPNARLGNLEASVITGKGVQAMMGTFDTQIKAAQDILAILLQDATSLCFEMDEVWWPTRTKTVRGTMSGRSYELTYRPKTDIAGNYTCDVTYGFAAGMSPQNAFITMLQAQGAGLISNETLQGLLPWGINPAEEQRNMDVEKTEEAILQGVFAALQASGQLLAQGMTDQATFWFQTADAVVRGRQNGRPANEIVAEQLQAFIQQQQQQAQEQQAAMAAAGGGGAGGPGGVPGVGADGLPPNVAPGQAGMNPGGMPTVQQLVAGFTGSGQASLGATVRRRLPAA